MSHFQQAFHVSSAAVHVRFGPGSRKSVADEVRRLGCRAALVLATPQQAETAHAFAATLGPVGRGVFAEAAMHTPVDITERAVRHARDIGADCVVAVGGGSTTGLGKAIAYHTDLPQIVVPTTYAGSEATPILGQTEAERKTTLSDPRVQPEVIVYDPELLTSLPVPLTVTSALNAMAHAAEALYAEDRNPLTSVLALEGLRAFHAALPRVVAAPTDVAARGETLYGAWLCGTALGQVGMALHHKLCHTLGGTLDLPHAETHAIILPHAVAYNEAAVPDLLAPLSAVLGRSSAAAGLHAFASQLGAPMALRTLGVEAADLDRVADLAAEAPYWNPRTISRDGIRSLLGRAWEGSPPQP